MFREVRWKLFKQVYLFRKNKLFVYLFFNKVKFTLMTLSILPINFDNNNVIADVEIFKNSIKATASWKIVI